MRRTFSLMLLSMVLYSFPVVRLSANEATDTFECSALAEWAGLSPQSKKLADIGYEAAIEDASKAIDLVGQPPKGAPNFLQGRSSDFWIGMWYGRSMTKIEDWLQANHPVDARAGAATPERVKVALQRLAEWKPVAALEYEDRACGLRLKGLK